MIKWPTSSAIAPCLLNRHNNHQKQPETAHKKRHKKKRRHKQKAAHKFSQEVRAGSWISVKQFLRVSFVFLPEGPGGYRTFLEATHKLKKNEFQTTSTIFCDLFFCAGFFVLSTVFCRCGALDKMICVAS